MFPRAPHLHWRDVRFLGLVGITLLIIALYLSTGLRLAEQGASGWRKLDLESLRRRIETGELRNREADWYHQSTREEGAATGGRQ